jgi:hypothetical protein
MFSKRLPYAGCYSLNPGVVALRKQLSITTGSLMHREFPSNYSFFNCSSALVPVGFSKDLKQSLIRRHNLVSIEPPRGRRAAADPGGNGIRLTTERIPKGPTSQAGKIASLVLAAALILGSTAAETGDSLCNATLPKHFTGRFGFSA